VTSYEGSPPARPSEQLPLPRAAPFRPQRWSRGWPVAPGAARLSRLYARMVLTMSVWAGDQSVAARVVTELVANAVAHVGAGRVTLVLVVAEDEELLIQVSGPSPDVPGFDEAVAARKARRFGLVRVPGGEISLGAPPPEGGKTVQVRMRPATPGTANAPSTSDPSSYPLAGTDC